MIISNLNPYRGYPAFDDDGDVVGVQDTFLLDNFYGAVPADVTAHTGEIGATWEQNSPTPDYSVYDGRLWLGLPPGDEDFADVGLLLHGDGPEGSTTITDSSLLGQTITASGGAVLENCVGAYGGSAIYFPTREINTRVTVPWNAEYDFLDQPFTIEFRIKFDVLNTDGGSPDVILNKTNGVTFSWRALIRWVSGSTYRFEFSAANTFVGSFVDTSSTFTLVTGTWYTFAVTSTGNTEYRHRLFKDGGTIYNSTQPYSINNMTGLGPIIICDQNLTYGSTLCLEELRIAKGVCRYTGDYTPLGYAFPDYPA